MENKVKITIIPTLNEFKVLSLSGKEGDVLKKHQVNQSALLIVRGGKITYAEKDLEEQLSAGDFKEISAKIVHQITCNETSDFLVILSSSTKMKFEK